MSATMQLHRHEKQSVSSSVSTEQMSQHEDTITMKIIFLGMLAMMDITAVMLAQATDVLWDKHLYHSLIGSTIAVMAFGGLYQATDSLWMMRRSMAAIAIGIVAGPWTADLARQWCHMEMNSISIVFASALWSLGGPYAVRKYGESAIERGAEYFHLKNGADEQHSIETPDKRNDETINGK